MGRRARRASAMLAALGLPTAACAFVACQTPTSMTFVIQTDADCAALAPRPLVEIVVSTEGDLEDTTGEPSATRRCEARASPGEVVEIGELVALPAQDEGAVVTMRVVVGLGRETSSCGRSPGPDGDAWDACLVARRRLAFLPGEALRVEVPLATECIGVPCDERTTCVPERGCVPIAIDGADCLGAGCGVEALAPTTSSSVAATTTTTASAGGGGGEGGASATSSSGEGAGPATDASSSASTASGAGPCGDGDTDDGEECDDGNTDDGDGCSATCEREATCDPPCPDPAAECLLGACEGRSCTTVLVERCLAEPGGSCDPCGRCCQGSACTPLRCPLGGPCTEDLDCQSGICREGVCCDAGCGDPAESCRVAQTGLPDGTCGIIVQ